jgi:flagellar motor switch/type III secretory pathway protein FliN
MQVMVNGVVVAYGEVVIVDERTAIRITELVAPPSNEVGE